MAATIAKARGCDKTREKCVHRLGSESSTGEANTWRTFTKCHVTRDGMGFVRVTRDGKILHAFTFGAED